MSKDVKNTKKKKIAAAVIIACIAAALIVGIVLTDPLYTSTEEISDVMQDAVLHEHNKVSLFGLEVNPALISAIAVTIGLLLFALIVRIVALPRFKHVPGKFQLFIETVVGLFDGLAKKNSPHRNGFLGAYVFAAGVYIAVGTTFELIGIPVETTAGTSVSLPAPLSDINAALALGFLSYFVILSGGIAGAGLRGVGRTLKDFSLPVSMSFRLFGALLSGLLVTELVYYYLASSFVLPVLVAVLFTLMHALIQTYVLVMLTTMFYGEVSEPPIKKEKKHKSAAKRGAAHKNITVSQEV